MSAVSLNALGIFFVAVFTFLDDEHAMYCCKSAGFITDGLHHGYPHMVTKRTVLCFVTFDSPQDHVELVRDYLSGIRVSLDKQPTLLDWFNCTHAILTEHCREGWKRYSFKETKLVSDNELPQSPPTASTEKYRIWITEISQEEIPAPD